MQSLTIPAGLRFNWEKGSKTYSNFKGMLKQKSK